MLVLKTKDSNRQFKIYDQNWNFLMGILSHDMLTSDTTISLSDSNSLLANYESEAISKSIKKVLSNNTIYEVWDGVKIEPLIDPSTKVLHNLKNMAQPLTEKRRIFLENLSEFLTSNKDLRIKRE